MPVLLRNRWILLRLCTSAVAKWLAAHWRSIFWAWRVIITVAIAGLMTINAFGLYSQLVISHLGDRGTLVAAIDARANGVRAHIEQHTAALADVDRQIAQLDAAIAAITQRGKASAGLDAVEAQRKNRAALVDQRTREAEALAELKVSEGQVVTQGRKVADELMPVRYVAELLGIGADDERSIRWLILLMVLVCDPLAVALSAGVSSRRRG